jgi:lipopolysaccharide/colanic/teichoic acid biosynthesis glycosyltransferase
MKRALDVIASGLGLLALSPLLLALGVLIWLQDGHSPFYVASRTGRHYRPYRMVKFRSMIVRADRTGVDSTATNDPRITPLGRFIRRFKLDELPQLWNVLKGEMSLVGPRPNVDRETAIYTAEERRLLSIRPGITDLASIVFSDEGEILAGSADPDLRYNQVIRPWKSRLSLLYVDHSGGVLLDLRLIWLTLVGAVDRARALAAASRLAHDLGAGEDLVTVARRDAPLVSAPPPGATKVVENRDATPT